MNTLLRELMGLSRVQSRIAKLGADRVPSLMGGGLKVLNLACWYFSQFFLSTTDPENMHRLKHLYYHEWLQSIEYDLFLISDKWSAALFVMFKAASTGDSSKTLWLGSRNNDIPLKPR